MTHGAVSQQIRRLEAELGARLFELGFWAVWRADRRKLRRIHALRDWLMAAAKDAANAEVAELA